MLYIALVLLFCSLLLVNKVRIQIPRTWKWRKDSNPSPPEVPGALPFIGHLAYLGSRPHLKLMDWAKTYGSLFLVKFGNLPTLVVDDPTLMQEIFSDNAFSGRIKNDVFDYQSQAHGIILSEGETWESQRRFTLKHLRDFGFKKNFMENLILDEVKEVLEMFEENTGKTFTIKDPFSLPVVNALWTITVGAKIPHGNATLLNLHTEFVKAFNKLITTGVMFAPAIRHIAPSLSGWNEYVEKADALANFIQEAINDHEESFEPENPRDLIDSYLIEIKKTEDPKSPFYKREGYKNLHATVGDIFKAGAETTSTTLNWAVLYLTQFPEVQQRVHEEVISVVGLSRGPSLSDRPNLHYTEATIYEVLRMSSMVPLGVMHKTLYDKEIRGLMVRKGTVVMGNLYSAHHSPKHWKDPEEFRPERFLSPNGDKLIKNPPAFIPFQIGKRRCLGEAFAMETLFLFVASIFQKFRVSKSNENDELNLKGVPGFVLTPHSFHVNIQKRF